MTKLLMSCITLLLTSLTLASPPGPEPLKFMRDPHIANGMIVFSYQGDIWLTTAEGANPHRLTAHPANDWAPRFSPDGQQVAFSSDRTGNNDVFVVPVTGGEPKQLTYFTGNDEVEYRTPDGRGIVISTQRSTHPFGSPLYIVPLDGKLPEPMAMDFARAGMIRQDGSMVVFTRENKNETRKGYRGNNSADIYVQDPGKPNNYGINLENYGVAPDVMVENTPEDELRGFDRELKTAIHEAQKMLREGRWQYTNEAKGKGQRN